MSVSSRDIRDQAMLSFDMDEYFRRESFYKNPVNFVRELISGQNKLLDSDTQLIFYSPNS